MIIWILYCSVWSHVFVVSSSAERKPLRSARTIQRLNSHSKFMCIVQSETHTIHIISWRFTQKGKSTVATAKSRRIHLRRDYLQQWLPTLKLLCIRGRLLSILTRTQCLRPRETTVWLADFFLPSLRQAAGPGNPLYNRWQTYSSSTTKLVLCKTKYVKEIAKC